MWLAASVCALANGANTFAGTGERATPDASRHQPKLADIYSFGVILYELLAGRKPSESKSFAGVIDQIRDCTPVAPSKIRDDVPADLETIALKCMSENPDDRYAYCQTLVSKVRCQIGRRMVLFANQ